MSHRENSLTPWLGPRHPDVPPATWDEATGRWSDDAPNSDDEKHMFCLRRTGAVATFLPAAMYDAASAQGCDMRWYVKQQPMPTTGEGVFVIEHKLPTSAEMRAEMKRKLDAGERLGASHDHATFAPSKMERLATCPGSVTRGGNPKKHRDERGCGGSCMIGLGGSCTACAEHDEQ